MDLYGISKKLMPLLHLPVQSGSDKILKAMNRKHTIKEYLNIINKLQTLNKNIKFSSDFIIAYPGETEADFKNTIKLMRQVKFINSYSYIFSPRLGTPAASLSFVDRNIAKNRLINFQKISNEIKKEYKNGILGTTAKVLIENKIGTNQFFGRDEYLNSVIINCKHDIIGKIINVKIKDCNLHTTFGDLANKNNVAA